MTSIYLAGYDGSPESHSAVQLALRLARSRKAQVLAVHVYPYPSATYWIPVEAPRFEELEEKRRADAQAVLDKIDLPDVGQYLVEADSAARGLHDLAIELGADLIAVGATHQGAVGRLATGSVGMHLLHGAPCPVLVTPHDGRDPLRSIGVAYDGRDESRAALHAGADLAGALNAQLLVMGAYQPVLVPAAAGVPGTPSILEGQEARFEEMLQKAAAEVGANTSYRMLRGPGGHTIAEASADVDLLVTGSRGYGAIRGVLLGSVSRHLVDHAACPVLVVPRPR